jgi:3-isopropylmalate/(R)-2-methylmalate dehydratase large subunit
MTVPRTLFAKIWDAHVIEQRPDGSCLLHVDRHVIHEATSGQAFVGLAERGLTAARPSMHLAVADHSVPTVGRHLPLPPGRARDSIEALARNAAATGIEHIPHLDRRQGICHVIAPEQGFVQPGMIAVCGDSHTATLGGLGAFGFGIGTSEVEHVLATGALVQQRPQTMAVEVTGRLSPGVTAKDLILAVIGRIGAGGGTGHVIEFCGEAVRALPIEGRLTLCNMAIEAGARSGMVAPDEVTIAYLEGRPMAPRGDLWRRATDSWRALATDPDAVFDRKVTLDGAEVAPQVTWGTSPQDTAAIDSCAPDPDLERDPLRAAAMRRALSYQGLTPGTPMSEVRIDRVFIGSCTNSRLSDLRDAARFVTGRTLAPGVQGFVSPGSTQVKAEAEAEGLDKVFTAAGFEWRESACSMCGGGDPAPPGARVAATSNRNFEHRQGRDVRTHIVSPAMAAAAGVAGRFVDVRKELP